MRRKRIRSQFCLLLGASILTGCGSSSSFYDKVDLSFGATGTSDINVNDTLSKVQPDSGFIKYHGRYYYDESLESTWFNFSNSGFEITFTGTSLEGAFYATKADDDMSRPYLALFIDNDYASSKATYIKITTAGKGKNGQAYKDGVSLHPRVKLISDLENREHTARIYKISESNVSHIGLKSLATDGKFSEVKPKKLDYKMEVYGDSVTCGYAINSTDYYQNFCSQTEDSTKSFSNVCANLLNSDISTIACGGYPLYKSQYSENCTPDSIPQMFNQASSEWNTESFHTWDNALYIPDFAVIALGANDCSIYNGLSSEEKEGFRSAFKKAYRDFFDVIFTVYPLTHIIVSEEIIPFNEDIINCAKEAVEEYNKNNSHEDITYFATDAREKATDQTTPGAGHPNSEMNSLAGQELYEHILGLLK